MTEEKPITRLVRNIWGSWDALYTHTKTLMRSTRKNNGEIGSKQFCKEMIGYSDMSRDEYRLAVQAVHIAITKIRKEEQKEYATQEREKKQEVEQEKEKIIKSASRQEMREIRRSGGEEEYFKTIFR